MKRTLVLISQYLIALLFIFSGFVKCVDPTGTALKMEEYFYAFGTDFLVPFAMAFALVMCGVELLIGVLLLLNIRVKLAIWGALLMMLFYTPLTLWLAISDKVTDCGCFGDAIKLSNWGTFIKNLIIDVFLLILFLGRKTIKPRLKARYQTGGLILFTLIIGVFEWYSITRLPVIDFLPYKTGANIQEGMISPADNPPIHDFVIFTQDGQVVTDLVLDNSGINYLLVIASLEKANLKYFNEVNRIYESAITKGYGFYAVTSSLPEEYEHFREQTKASYPIYMMDGTTLKTMIRSNPGLLLLENGTIRGKWHFRSFDKALNFTY